MKNNILGWKSVFWFAFVQDTKNKVLRISTLVLCVIALLVCPIVLLIDGDESGNEETTSLQNIYVVDYTGLNLITDLQVLKSDSYYAEDEPKLYTEIDYIDRTEQVQAALLEQQNENPEKIDWNKVYTFREETDTGAYMELQFVGEGIHIRFVYDADTKVTDDDVIAFSDFVNSHFWDVLMQNQKISEEDRMVLEASWEVFDAKELDETDIEDIENADDVLEDEESHEDTFGFEYTIVMIVILMLSMAGGRISVAILTEKSSKIMEYLLTSIRPMAIVVGKVLASLLTLCVQGLCVAISLGLSVLVAGFMNGDGSFVLPNFVKEIFESQIVKNVEPMECILAILIIILGFFFYGLLAAMAGAAVSRMEDVAEGAKIYTFIMIIGAYLGMFTSMAGDGANEIVKYLACLLPISSMFITPGSLLASKLSVVYGAIALVILIVSLVFLTKFVSSVYESLVYYNGSPLKMKDIINISKEAKKQKRIEASEEGGEQ